MVRLLVLIIVALYFTPASAEVDKARRLLGAEYGLSYHDVDAKDTSNGGKGKIVSLLSPYWKGTWTHRVVGNLAYRLSFKTQLVTFEAPEDIDLKKSKQNFNTGEFALLWQTSPYQQVSVFARHQERILYRAQSEDKFEILKRPFIEPGLGLQWGNRRRIGLQVGVGLQGFLVLPTKAESIATGSGIGYGGNARIGWVTASGIVVTIKGFYDYATSPNSTIQFSHVEYGYALLTTYSF